MRTWLCPALCAVFVACSGSVKEAPEEEIIDRPPLVEILKPTGTEALYTNQPIELIAFVSDPEDDPATLAVQWSSDVAGVLGTGIEYSGEGQMVGSVRLDEGLHQLQVWVMDSADQSAMDEVEVSIGPTSLPPNCAIAAPVDGAVGGPSTAVTLQASISSFSVSSDALTAEWGSTLDGILGETGVDADGIATLVVDDWSVGDHTIQLIARDDRGGICMDTIVYRVGGGPTVDIVAPVDGSLVQEGAPVFFAGRVSDGIDSVDTLHIQWTSDQDGVLNERAADEEGTVGFETADLSVGAHTISLRAENSLGMTDDVRMSLTVNGQPSQPEIVISPDPATSCDDLLVNVVDGGESVDPEGGLVSYRYTWYQDGLEYMDGSEPAVSALATTKGEQWRVVVTPSDGTVDGPPADDEIVLGNAPPEMTGVALIPDAAGSEDSLFCMPVELRDCDDPDPRHTIAWYIDGAVQPETTSAMSPTQTRRGNTVYCEVTPSDDDGTGETVRSNVVTISGFDPFVSDVQLGPEGADTHEDLRCTPGTLEHSGVDVPTLAVAWFMDGVLQDETTDTLRATRTHRGQEVYCEVTATDAEGVGPSIRSNVLTIGNSAPSLADVYLSEHAVRAGDTPSCEWLAEDFSDADGDADASTVKWYVNGALASEGPVADGRFVRGDDLQCVATPFDGTDEGEPVSVSVTVLNTPPRFDSARMEPALARAGDRLNCAPWGYSDVDGDADESMVFWDIDGTQVATGRELADGFVGGDVVSCRAVPFDGYDEGDAVTSTQTIENSPPSLVRAEIAPSAPKATDELVCSYDGFEDPDGDGDESQFTWLVNGAEQASRSASLSGVFAVGDSVECQVTPYDGWQEGELVKDVVTIGNAPPTVTSVVFSPALVFTDDVVEASVVGSDPDLGDAAALSFRYEWQVEGVVVGSDDRTLDGHSDFEKGEMISLTVMANDGKTWGEPYRTDPIEVQNSAPEGLVISIDPEFPDAGTTPLVCRLDVLASDPDDMDEVQYDIVWYRNEALFSGVGTTFIEGDTVAAEAMAGGDEWTCAVTAHDGTVSADTVRADVVVAGWLGRTSDNPATSCLEVLRQNPVADDGLFYLNLGGETFQAHCDMSTDGGGWTLVTYAPSNRGAPFAFLDGDAHDRTDCSDFGDAFCRFSDEDINEILSIEDVDVQHRFRLIAPGLPGHTRYYWSGDTAFDSNAPPSPSKWWKVALEHDGESSLYGCGHPDSLGTGHDPDHGMCMDDPDFGVYGDIPTRVFFVTESESLDGVHVGSTIDSTFSWYAR